MLWSNFLPCVQTKGLDEESEATLLTALTEILDNVDDENLSPFDTLPDSDLLSGQKGREHSPVSAQLSYITLKVSRRFLPPPPPLPLHPNLAFELGAESERRWKGNLLTSDYKYTSCSLFHMFVDITFMDNYQCPDGVFFLYLWLSSYGD